MKKLTLCLVFLACVFARPAAADAPDNQHVSIDATFPSSRCGFPLRLSLHWTVIDHVWIYDDGSAREMWANAESKVVLTNPANGKTLTTVAPEPVRLDFAPDGSLTMYSDGIHLLYTVPGVGLDSAAVGRLIVYSPYGLFGPRIVMFEEGMHDSPYPEICQYLQ